MIVYDTSSSLQWFLQKTNCKDTSTEKSGVYLSVKTCELFLCFVPCVLLGSIVLTAPFLYCFLCLTSPVSFTGSYTEDEPENVRTCNFRTINDFLAHLGRLFLKFPTKH